MHDSVHTHTHVIYVPIHMGIHTFITRIVIGAGLRGETCVCMRVDGADMGGHVCAHANTCVDIGVDTFVDLFLRMFGMCCDMCVCMCETCTWPHVR